MLVKKIMSIRNRFYEYDDSKFITIPHFGAGEIIGNMFRGIYRRVQFLFCSLGILGCMLVLVKSSKYKTLQKLHYEDLLDCMKES